MYGKFHNFLARGKCPEDVITWGIVQWTLWWFKGLYPGGPGLGVNPESLQLILWIILT